MIFPEFAPINASKRKDEFSAMNENLVLQERFSQYLDVVEMHLVKEIWVRSNSCGNLSVRA